MTKDEVRAHARSARACARRASPTARTSASSAAPRAGRASSAERLALHPAEVVDAEGEPAGTVDAVELVTVGQRRGMGHGSDGKRRYVTHVDVAARRVTVGGAERGHDGPSVLAAAASLTWVRRRRSSAGRGPWRR